MNKLKSYTIKGIIFVVILGCISHFVFDWTGNNIAVGFLFPVNESIWEHMKLFFYPMALYSIYMNKKLEKDYPYITTSLLLGIISGTLVIPVIYYTYSGILGYHVTLIDILILFISIFLSFVLIYKMAKFRKSSTNLFLMKAAVIIIAVCFILFTYFPPKINLFFDPTLQ